MPVNKYKILLLSDTSETGAVLSLIKDIKTKDLEVSTAAFEHFSLKDENLILFYFNALSASILSALERIKTSEEVPALNARLVFIIRSNDAQSVSILAKMGYNDIFVFPYELYKIVPFLEDLTVSAANSTHLQSAAFSAGSAHRPKAAAGNKTAAENKAAVNNAAENKASENNKALDSVNSNDEELSGKNLLPSIFGSVEDISNIMALAQKAAENPAINVLILGETGTGKSLLARTIHDLSERLSSPFVEIICTAIPENLLESELFGYEKGAFTDARNKKPGLFELANNGTIFLDEIGDLSPGLQAKLLQVSEKKVIRHLGGIQDIPVNTRIIAATNRDIQELVEKQTFRKDLYYRLNIITFELKPLRQRGNDIRLLANRFLREFSNLHGKCINEISTCAWELILNYCWPGNVRELRHAVERAVLLCDEPVLSEMYFSGIKANSRSQQSEINSIRQFSDDLSEIGGHSEIITLYDLNRLYARRVLSMLSGNKSRASRLLGISRPTLDTLIGG